MVEPLHDALDEQLVHRTRDSEIFLVSAGTTGDGVHASGRVPSNHSRLPDIRGVLPEILGLEIFRQVGFFAAHTAIGIPMGWHLVTTRFGLMWQTAPPIVSKSSTFWFNVTGHAQAQANRVLRFTAELHHEGVVIALGSIEALSVSPHRYQALRRRFINVATVPHNEIGTPLGDETEAGWTVRWNDQDPFLFNRPGDHVVSMALIEAVLAGARRESDERYSLSVDMEFHNFADRNATITLRRTGNFNPTNQRWELEQNGRIVAQAITRRVPVSPTTSSDPANFPAL
jgi:hypothetical protein